jgi:integrase
MSAARSRLISGRLLCCVSGARGQAAERLAWGLAYVDREGLIFAWEDGSPVLPDYISKAFGKAQAACGLGLPRLVHHEARHSHATVLLRDGVPVHIVAKRLGHKDPSVTLNVYADVIPDDDGRAVDVLSTAAWGRMMPRVSSLSAAAAVGPVSTRPQFGAD